MARLTPNDYDRLERAVRDGRRIILVRQGRELVVIPLQLSLRAGREILDTRHPVTGEPLSFRLDDVDTIEYFV